MSVMTDLEEEEEIAQLSCALKVAEEKLERMQMQVIQAGKLELLGRMAAEVTHEVKNPLGMLQMGVDFFNQRRKSSDVAGELMLRRMGEAIERADRIVCNLVDFSRLGDLSLCSDDLNLVLQKGLNLTHHELTRRKVVVVTDFREPLPAVRIDRAKIEQVVIILITNAAQAMPGGGELEVKTYSEVVGNMAKDEQVRSLEPSRVGDRFVVAEIRDHGPGISAEKLEKIFDPFYTTKAAGKGSGLGLAVAKSIMDLNGGTIRIRNDETGGARVGLVFPADESALEEEEAGSLSENRKRAV